MAFGQDLMKVNAIILRVHNLQDRELVRTYLFYKIYRKYGKLDMLTDSNFDSLSPSDIKKAAKLIIKQRKADKIRKNINKLLKRFR